MLNVLKGTPATFGFIGAAAGLGEVVGGLLVGNLKIRRVGVGIYAFSGLLGVGFGGYGIAPLLPVVLVAAFTFAVSIVMANTLWESALQKHVPRRLLGRVNSVDEIRLVPRRAGGADCRRGGHRRESDPARSSWLAARSRSRGGAARSCSCARRGSSDELVGGVRDRRSRSSLRACER